jgi:hypothetical protein
MTVMKTEVEDVVRRVNGGVNTIAKSRKRDVGFPQSPAKRGRKKAEEDDERERC